MLGIIGGSGLYELPELLNAIRRQASTCWGEPSDAIALGQIGRTEVAFLSRHARGHRVPPHKINYRANMQALRDAGATSVIAVAAVGGIASDCTPGVLVIPDQLIDYTSNREATVFDGGEHGVTHVDFTDPYDADVRSQLALASRSLGLPVVEGGVYGCTNGPRLETAAEIRRLARDGCTIVGMTGMPEAGLARELGLPYACLAAVANAAAGLGDSRAGVSIEVIMSTLDKAMVDVRRVLVALCEARSI